MHSSLYPPNGAEPSAAPVFTLRGRKGLESLNREEELGWGTP